MVKLSRCNESSMDQAKAFIKKYCQLAGSGISFDKDDGVFTSWIEIKSKQDNYSKIDWWERTEYFAIYIKAQDAIILNDGKLENLLDADLFKSLIKKGLAEMRELYAYQVPCFQLMLSKLGITEDECIGIMAGLYLDKCKSIMDKSFPVVQRAYDRWAAKGDNLAAKKERIASTFGKAFIDDLTKGVESFHDAYIESETGNLFVLFKKQYGSFNKYTEEELREKAKEEAISSWPLWCLSEVSNITDILMRYDVGKCEHYDLRFDPAAMRVEGVIYGDTGKQLKFHTIFAGGYNIQKLHTRTIAHIF